MEIILLEDVARLGTKGDVTRVADGYARNYLFPKKLAVKNTPSNQRYFEHLESQAKLRQDKLKHEAEKLAHKLEDVSCTAAVQAGEDDKLFGSVTSADIANLLKAQGIDIDRRKIQLDEPLKALGVYVIPIKLHPEVEAKVKVWVVKA
ncbi:MAG: 50S ribosomal protein L9 [Gemmatimonadetes bacterium]|nr:MAG: 50S ribosomal protein L9 [Gemmatimonadota bacterium]